jgi:hypothetical protein
VIDLDNARVSLEWQVQRVGRQLIHKQQLKSDGSTGIMPPGRQTSPPSREPLRLSERLSFALTAVFNCYRYRLSVQKTFVELRGLEPLAFWMQTKFFASADFAHCRLVS